VLTLLLPRNTGFELGISAATETTEFHFPNFVSALLSAALAMNPLLRSSATNEKGAAR